MTFRTIATRLRPPNARSEAGFTLIEVLVATVILVVGLIGLLGLLDASVKASATTRAREGATSLAREIIEDARTIPYAQIISTATLDSQLQTMPVEGKYPLADGSSAPGWQIERRGFTYTVKVEECAIDDPKDGLATAKIHEEGEFCPGQQAWKAGEAEDTTPEDLKRITAEVGWTFQKRTSTVKQVSTLTAAGQAIGLVATKLELTSPYDTTASNSTPTTPVITNDATKTLTFSVSFPEGTTAIIWSLEGAKQKPELTPASKATSLTFSWTISELKQKTCGSEGTSDGTYQVAAQAVDATGVIGPPISIPVRLIRGIPVAPCEIRGDPEILGGFNTVYHEDKDTKVVELEWEANAERNVIGYRVYGPANPVKELVCPGSLETLSTTTSCMDFAPVEGIYSVVALYRDKYNEVQQSPPRERDITQAASVAPNAPTALVATKEPDGSVTLKWRPSTGGSAPVLFYRIYRSSTDYTSRYGTTSSTDCSPECTFTDTDAATRHQYWVTAVSSTLTESTFEGPASG